MESSLVNLSIPANITQPIVAAKIQEAITIAMGGADKIIATVVKTICETKVNPHDGKVSTYSSENKVSWIDFHVTTMLQDAIKEELKKQVIEVAAPVKEQLLKQIQTKKGASVIADALLAAMGGNLSDAFSTKIDIAFNAKKTNNNW